MLRTWIRYAVLYSSIADLAEPALDALDLAELILEPWGASGNGEANFLLPQVLPCDKLGP